MNDEEKIKEVMRAVAMALVKTDGYSLVIERDMPRMVELSGYKEPWPQTQRIGYKMTLYYNEVVKFGDDES